MQEEEDYCSDFCETAREDAACDCEHMACTAKTARDEEAS